MGFAALRDGNGKGQGQDYRGGDEGREDAALSLQNLEP
jgi:hypothetical protein